MESATMYKVHRTLVKLNISVIIILQSNFLLFIFKHNVQENIFISNAIAIGGVFMNFSIKETNKWKNKTREE